MTSPTAQVVTSHAEPRVVNAIKRHYKGARRGIAEMKNHRGR
jgi:hypothetical protein